MTIGEALKFALLHYYIAIVTLILLYFAARNCWLFIFNREQFFEEWKSKDNANTFDDPISTRFPTEQVERLNLHQKEPE
jgi:hypothetical protein